MLRMNTSFLGAGIADGGKRPAVISTTPGYLRV
jgi:hypothetical protein